MALLGFLGFEEGSGGNLGTSSIGTAHVHSGSYALQVNPTTTGTGEAILSFTPSTDAYLSVYIWIVSLPASASEEIITFREASTLPKLQVRINSTGTLAVYDAGFALVATGATVLSTGAWYRIDVHSSNAGGSTAAYAVQINGVAELSGTCAQQATNPGQVSLGKLANRNGQGYEIWYDDAAVDSAAFPGVQQTLLLTANAVGTYQTATVGAGAGHWQAVSEVPHDSSTSYLVSDGTTGDAETENFTDTATAGIGGTVNGVSMRLVSLRDGASNGSIKPRLRSATTNSDGSAITTTVAYSLSSPFFSITDPATSAAWTLSAVDALEAGFVENQTGAAKSRVTAVYVNVNFTNTSVSKSDSDTPAFTDAGAAPPAAVPGSETWSANDGGSIAAALSNGEFFAVENGHVSESGSVDTGSSVSKSSSETWAFADAGTAPPANFNAGDTTSIVSASGVNTGGVAKPPSTWGINSGHALASGLVFCLLYNEGPGATQITDYVSGVKSSVDSRIVWTTITGEAPISGPAVDNLSLQLLGSNTNRAIARFDQGGALLADALFTQTNASPYTGGYTVMFLAKPGYDGTPANGTAYVCDNSGQQSPGNPANYTSYLNSVGNPGWVGETIKNSSGSNLGAALTEFQFDSATTPWVFCIKVMGSGTSGGMQVFTNLDVSGLPADVMRRAATSPTADCHNTLGPSAIGGFDGLGVWGTLSLSGSPAMYGLFVIWNRPLSVTLDGSNNVIGGDVLTLFNNPAVFMQAPTGTTPSSGDSTSITEAQTLAAAVAAPDAVAFSNFEGVNTGGTSVSSFNIISFTDAAAVPPATLQASDPVAFGEGQSVVSSAGAQKVNRRFTGSTWRHLTVAPSSLTATPASTTQLNLAWNLPSGSMNPKSVHVEESTDGGTTWTEIAVLPPGTTAYARTGLSHAQTRKYRVREQNNNGLGPYSNVGTGTTS